MFRYAVVAVAVAACGRSGFNPETGGGDASIDTPIDSPRLAALVCSATTIPIDPVAPDAEVAAYRSSAGYTSRGISTPRSSWIAWIDEGASDQLHLASFDLKGNVKDVALPDWKPVGDQAFQLVRRGATVYLVVLSANTVNFLLTCS